MEARPMFATFLTATLALVTSPADNDHRTPVIDPAREATDGGPRPPDEAVILRALRRTADVPGVYTERRDDIQIVKECLVNRVDEPRFFPMVGVARLHHVHWKCSVYCNETIESSYPFPLKIKQPRLQVVYIDTDHLDVEPTSLDK
jgi:hypothetical protein